MIFEIMETDFFDFFLKLKNDFFNLVIKENNFLKF